MANLSGIELQNQLRALRVRLLIVFVTGHGDIPTSVQAIKAGAEDFLTKPVPGTGLGLSIARTIVETYGGRIWAENRAEGGAVFHFTLPLAKAAAA